MVVDCTGSVESGVSDAMQCTSSELHVHSNWNFAVTSPLALPSCSICHSRPYSGRDCRIPSAIEL